MFNNFTEDGYDDELPDWNPWHITRTVIFCILVSLLIFCLTGH